MDNKNRFVKFCIWIGILLDGSIVLLYLLPGIMLNSMGLSADMLTPATIYILFQAAILMLSWTILLAWTLQKPGQRRFVLLLTVLITVGMEASAIYLLTVENIVKLRIIPLLILPVIIAGLFTAAYLVAGSLEP